MGLARLREERLQREEEEKKAEQVRRALEEYRRGEREAAAPPPVQGPPPAPAPLPDPWQRPVFGAPDPGLPTREAPPLIQMQSPGVDTGVPSLSSSQERSPTVQSQLPQAPMPGVQPRPMSPELQVSLSDRLRDPYGAPNRPMLPTQAQGPAAQPDPWQRPTFGQPQQQQTVEEYLENPFGNRQTIGTWIGQQPAGQYWQQQYNQNIERANDTLPSETWQRTPLMQSFNENKSAPQWMQNVGEAMGFTPDQINQAWRTTGIPAWQAVDAATGNPAQTAWAAIDDPFKYAGAVGMDLLNKTFDSGRTLASTPRDEWLAYLAGNPMEPGSGQQLPPLAEAIAAGGVVGEAIKNQTWGNPGRFLANLTTGYLTGGGLQRAITGEIDALFDSGQYQRNMDAWWNAKNYINALPTDQKKNAQIAWAMGISGGGAVENAARDLATWEQQKQEVRTQAEAAGKAGDDLTAAQLGIRLNEMERMTPVDIIEQYMNIPAEFVYGALVDPGSWALELGATASRAKSVLKYQDEAKALFEINTAQAKKNIDQAISAAQGTLDRIASGRGVKADQWWKFVNPAEWFARTPESKANIDADWLMATTVDLTKGITSKEDAKRVLLTMQNDATQLFGPGAQLGSSPVQLRGAGNVTQFDPGVVGNEQIAKRLPILKILPEGWIDNLESLKGEGTFNPIEFLAELDTVFYDAARQFNGVRALSQMPVGATDTRVRRLPDGTAVLEYVGDDKKVIRTSEPMTFQEARLQQQDIKKAQQSVGDNILLGALRGFTNFQRGILSDQYLALSPRNWIRNALGASTMAYSVDSLNGRNVKSILDDLARDTGGAAPTFRTFAAQSGYNRGQKLGASQPSSGFLDSAAAAITGNSDNPISRFMQGAYQIPYGQTEIPVGGGQSIGIGEEANFLKIFDSGYQRVKKAGWDIEADSLLTGLVQMGVPEDWAQRLAFMVSEYGPRTTKDQFMTKLYDYVHSDAGIDATLKAVGIDPDLLGDQWGPLVNDVLEVLDTLTDEQAAQAIGQIFDNVRQWPARTMAEYTPQSGRYQWTDFENPLEGGLVAQGLRDAATRASIDPAEAETAIQTVTDGIKNAEQSWDVLRQDLADLTGRAVESGTAQGLYRVVMDFVNAASETKDVARQAVDKASRYAVAMQTPEAWAKKWQANIQVWSKYAEDLTVLGQEYRAALGAVARGEPFTSKSDPYKVIRRWMEFDPEAWARAQGYDLGAARMEDAWMWDEVIGQNRARLDNSLLAATEAFRRYPSSANFDLLAETFRELQRRGAQAAGFLNEAKNQGAKGQRFWNLRNQTWAEYFNEMVNYNKSIAKVMVALGLSDEMGDAIRWTDNFSGGEFRLLYPNEDGTWQALRTADNEMMTFSSPRQGFVGDARPEVPQEVLDAYNTALGRGDEMVDSVMADVQAVADAAPPAVISSEQALQEISDSAPDVLRPVEPDYPYSSSWDGETGAWVGEGPDPRIVQSATDLDAMGGGVAQAIGDNYREGLRQSVESTGRLPATEYNNNKPSLIAQVYERMVREGSPRDATTLDNALGIVERGGDARGVQAEYNAWKATPGASIADDIAPVVDDALPVDVEFQPNVTLPESTAVIPTNDEIRRVANEAGIATATKDGRPTDRHLISSLNKRLNSSARNLDDLTDVQRMGAIDALRERGAEQAALPLDQRLTKQAILDQYGDELRAQGLTDKQLSRMSKREVAERINNPVMPEPSVTTVGDIAKMDVEGARDTRKAMAAEWNRVATGEWGLPKLDQVVMTYNRGGGVNMNLNAGEVRQFENLYGTTIGGMPIDNLDDVQRFVQQYVDLNKRVQQGEATVSKSKQFAKMSAQEILAETRDELIAAGFSDSDLRELGKNRRSLLDILASVRGEDVDGLSGMVAYDFRIPAFTDTEDGEDLFNTLRKRIFNSRRNGGMKAVEVGEAADDMLYRLNNAEQKLIDSLANLRNGVPNALTPQQRLQAWDKVRASINKHDNIVAQARYTGDKLGNWAMLNRGTDFRHIDSVLELIMPFHFFMSRMPSRLASLAVNKPGLVNLYYETERAINNYHNQAGTPVRLRESIPVGGEWFLGNPLAWAIPFNAYLSPNPYMRPDPSQGDIERTANSWLQWLPGVYPAAQYAKAAALDYLEPLPDGKKRTDDTELGDFIPLYRIGGYARQALTGKPGGEGFWRHGDQYDPYRVKRTVGVIAAEEGMNPVVGQYAQQVIQNRYDGVDEGNNVDPAFLNDAIQLADRAMKEAGMDRLLATGVSWATGMPLNRYPEGEREMRDASRTYGQLGYDANANPFGSKTARQDFLEQNPELPVWWSKDDDTPGTSARLTELYSTADILREQKKEAEDAAVAALDLSAAGRGDIYDARQVAGQPFQDQLDEIYGEIDEINTSRPQSINDPNRGMNPREVSQSFANGVMWQATQLPGKPEYPGDDATPAQWREYNQARAKWDKQQEDFIVRSLTSTSMSDVVRERRGPVEYSENEARELWWHFNHAREIPEERARLEQLDRMNDQREAANTAQLQSAKQRIKNGDQLLQKYLDTPVGEGRDALRESDWRYRAVTLAAYNTATYDALVQKFGQKGLQQYFEAMGKSPEWPGDNATEEQLQAYYKASNEFDAKYPLRDEVSLWLNGRYSWADQNSSTQPGTYDMGADYDQAVAIFGPRIFEIEREFNAASLKGTWTAWRNSHLNDYMLLTGYNEWEKAARQEPQSVADLPTARWGFNPATQNASYATEADRNAYPNGVQRNPTSVADVLRQPYDAPQQPLGGGGQVPQWAAPKLGGARQEAGINPPTETGRPRTAEQWANQNAKYVEGRRIQADIQARRADVGATWGEDNLSLWDEYFALPKDSQAREDFKSANPVVRAMLLTAYNPAEYQQTLQDGFSNEDILAWAGRPPYEGDGSARSAYWDSNPRGWLFNSYLNGRPQPYDPASDQEDFVYNWGADFNQAKELFGADIWDAVLMQRSLPDDRVARAQFYEQYPQYRAWADWWYANLPDNGYVAGASAGYGRGYGGYGGGGGGGGGRYVPRLQTPNIQARGMNPALWQRPQMNQWIPYSRPNPDWLQSGRELAPPPIRRWERPRW